MATIGTFTRTENGFSGAVKTLNLNVKSVKFLPVEGENENGPDFRVLAGTTQFGAAWTKQSDKGNAYLSVKLDDFGSPAPIVSMQVWSGRAPVTWRRSSGPCCFAVNRTGHRLSFVEAPAFRRDTRRRPCVRDQSPMGEDPHGGTSAQPRALPEGDARLLSTDPKIVSL